VARVILRSQHVTRDGERERERETNGGKRKGERKEDSGHGEKSIGTFWYRSFWYQKTMAPKLPRELIPYRKTGARNRSAEKGAKRAIKRRGMVTFGGSASC